MLSRLYAFSLFLVSAVVLCCAGLVWWQRGQDYYGGVQVASDILGLLFFMLLFPSMRALFRALFTFPNDYRQVLKVSSMNLQVVVGEGVSLHPRGWSSF